MVGYSLMVTRIAVVCLLAVTAAGVNIQGVFNQIAGVFQVRATRAVAGIL